MNKLILAFIIFLIILTNVQGQWEILNEGMRSKTIDFVNDQAGWIAGDHCLLKTQNGGETWEPIEVGYKFVTIDFIDESVGWALAGDQILKTMNGGQTWSLQINLSEGRLNSIYVVNDSVVYAAGAKSKSVQNTIFYSGVVLKTSDGGINWKNVSPINENNYFYSIHFFNPHTGLVIGRYHSDYESPGICLRTFNGGNTWDTELIQGLQAINNLQFTNNTLGYFQSDSMLFETNDTLSSWSIKAENVLIFDFVTDDTAYCIMSDSLDNHYFMKSTDAGDTWDKKYNLSNWDYLNIYFNKNDTGMIICKEIDDELAGTIIMKTLDGGDSWTLQNFDYPLYDVFFFDQKRGYACGGYGYGFHFEIKCGDLFYTINGGNDWSPWNNMPAVLTTCLFLNETVGFTIGFASSFYIYKTTDHGSNWGKVYENNYDFHGYYFGGNDLVFINEDLGWIPGRIAWDYDSPGAAILGTSDGGENWNIVWKYPGTAEYNYELKSIHAVGEKAWAVGEFGMIVKYTEQDQWQVQNSITDLPLKKIFFSDENHGWIFGGYDSAHLIFLKTTDGGNNWEEIPGFVYQLNDMFFENSLHGWAVGRDTNRLHPLFSYGIILETWNGGNNWNVSAEGLSRPLNAIHFKNGYGWAVGGNGLVLKYDPSTEIWIDEKNNKIYPTQYTLFQNYPNPFNPSTTIDFDLLKTSYVNLKIFNILGEEVATLVSDRLTAGSYSYEWTRSVGMASGVYLYRLKAGKYVEIKKMVLMR